MSRASNIKDQFQWFVLLTDQIIYLIPLVPIKPLLTALLFRYGNNSKTYSLPEAILSHQEKFECHLSYTLLGCQFLSQGNLNFKFLSLKLLMIYAARNYTPFIAHKIVKKVYLAYSGTWKKGWRLE